MLNYTIVAVAIAGLIITFFIFSLRKPKGCILEENDKPTVLISIGKDSFHLNYRIIDNELNVPLAEFRVLSLLVNSLKDHQELRLQWHSSFLEKDYIYPLPREVSLFQNMAVIALKMREFSIQEMKDRRFEKVFLSVYSHDVYLGTHTIIIWYKTHDYQKLNIAT